MSIMGIIYAREQKESEHRCVPHLIWFQRHERKPHIFAGIQRVSNAYRWRAFYRPWGKHCAEGKDKTLSKAMKQVFRFFERH